MKKALALAIGFCGLSSLAQAAAAPIQRIDIVNLLAHSKATPGVTASPVTVKFFTSGSSSTPCSTATLPYDGATSIFAGTGLACTTAITNVSVTPLAGNGNAVVYAPLASTAFTTTGKFSYQVEIIESSAPAFDQANGQCGTQGSVALTQQTSAE